MPSCRAHNWKGHGHSGREFEATYGERSAGGAYLPTATRLYCGDIGDSLERERTEHGMRWKGACGDAVAPMTARVERAEGRDHYRRRRSWFKVKFALVSLRMTLKLHRARMQFTLTAKVGFKSVSKEGRQGRGAQASRRTHVILLATLHFAVRNKPLGQSSPLSRKGSRKWSQNTSNTT